MVDMSLRRSRVNRGADIEARNGFNHTALVYAAIEGHVEFARMRLERGPVIDARDNSDQTPLYCAVEHGRTQVGQLLLGA